MTAKKKIAFIHRYGLEGWICCGGHAVPAMVEQLLPETEVYFFGPETTEPANDALRSRLNLHLLPWTFDRANPDHKWSRTLKFYLALPAIGKKCRKLGIDFIYWEETLPLGAGILQRFYGSDIGIMVMDFFVRIYAEQHPWLNCFRDLVEKFDCKNWKKIPVVYTHVEYAKQFLIERGLPSENIHVVPNPCDHSKFHPVDEKVRRQTRKQLGLSDQDLVLSHHGILHPNKGNDWIFERIAEVKNELPHLKFLLIGNGPEYSRLKKLAAKLGIEDRIIMTGWLPAEADLNNALASSDIGLVMRIGQETDHFHMTDTLNHEMACGKPILAVNLKGIAEFIDDRTNGYLFSGSEPEAFRSKLIALAGSAEKRRQFGLNALAFSKQTCNYQKCAEQTLAPILGHLEEDAYRV
ncbi:glycosyltransferase family 4 protein [Pontiella agarivorans]|uniref:Glycosyltransferase n=1 Tax=Pontiella agarivorans TaxID=3038953 RepID=A0ABU5N057_9BACT|nr:glycosyltransferase [Pontiella agarivorans]MDZ8119827.1 glycosyltransferase [Pontiella agarivorans]